MEIAHDLTELIDRAICFEQLPAAKWSPLEGLAIVTASGGATGPHTAMALPGRMLITATSNNKDHGGRSALVEYTNDGTYVATYWIPTPDHMQGATGAENADGYNYDVRVLPRKNVMLTSSWTGWANYMRDARDVVTDPEAMKRFGNSVTVWNLHTRQPITVERRDRPVSVQPEDCHEYRSIGSHRLHGA